MIFAIVWIAVMSSLHLPESNGRSMSLPDRAEGLLHVSPPHNGEHGPCGFDDLDSKYWQSCRKNDFSKFLYYAPDDGIITGQQLLRTISSVCSNYRSFRRCANCTAKQDCPLQRAELFEFAMGKRSIFCEKDQVSDWLQKILQNGYRYNQSCDDVVRERMDTCYDKADTKLLFNDTARQIMSLSEGFDRFRLMFSSTFKCSIGEVLGLSERLRQECGSTWQDVLLTKWLRLSTFTTFGYNMNEDEISMLQEMRC